MEIKKDFNANQEGSIVTIIPLTQVAKDWLNENVDSEPWMWMGPALCVDWRYGGDILNGMECAGLIG